MSDRLKEIRELAEACGDADLDTVQDGAATYREFAAEAHPQAILELLDRIEELEGDREFFQARDMMQCREISRSHVKIRELKAKLEEGK